LNPTNSSSSHTKERIELSVCQGTGTARVSQELDYMDRAADFHRDSRSFSPTLFDFNDQDEFPTAPDSPTMESSVPSTPLRPRTKAPAHRAQPRPIHTSTGPMTANLPHAHLHSAPTSPPTPAPSPTPNKKAPDWSTAAEHEDTHVRDVRALFSGMNDAEKQRLLAELLNMCNSQQLGFVHDFVSPRLKKDPFTTLPNELCLRVR
jgi:F-box and WD-40 domain protein CDC4